MFSPPPIIRAELFARIPPHLSKLGHSSAWLDLHLRGAPRHCLLEGPSFDLDGRLYVVDTAFGRVFRLSADGAFSVIVEYDGQPNGLKCGPDGRIFIADHTRGLLELKPESGELTTIVAEGPDGPFQGLNDLFFASNSDLYLTDQGQSGLQNATGRVFRWRERGQLETVLERIPSPNGIVMNLDETCLFVAVTRDNAVWRAPLLLDGTVSKVGAFLRLSGGIGPDGIALDNRGGLAVAHIGLGSVWIFDPRGEPLARVVLPEGSSPTNVAYGGPGLGQLFITEAETGSIYVASGWGTAGKPMFLNRTLGADAASFGKRP